MLGGGRSGGRGAVDGAGVTPVGPNPLLGLSCKVLSAGFAVFGLPGYANRGTVGSIAPQRLASATLRTGSETARRGGDARAICGPARASGTGWGGTVEFDKSYGAKSCKVLQSMVALSVLPTLPW